MRDTPARFVPRRGLGQRRCAANVDGPRTRVPWSLNLRTVAQLLSAGPAGGSPPSGQPPICCKTVIIRQGRAQRARGTPARSAARERLGRPNEVFAAEPLHPRLGPHARRSRFPCDFTRQWEAKRGTGAEAAPKRMGNHGYAVVLPAAGISWLSPCEFQRRPGRESAGEFFATDKRWTAVSGKLRIPRARRTVCDAQCSQLVVVTQPGAGIAGKTDPARLSRTSLAQFSFTNLAGPAKSRHARPSPAKHLRQSYEFPACPNSSMCGGAADSPTAWPCMAGIHPGRNRKTFSSCLEFSDYFFPQTGRWRIGAAS